MKDLSKHIALLLFAGFVFPQIANSVHYFVVPHSKNSDEVISRQFTNPAYDYHSCDYHLTGLNFVLPSNPSPEHQAKFIEKIQPIDYEFGHEVALAFNYQLRGPPTQTASPMNNNKYN